MEQDQLSRGETLCGLWTSKGHGLPDAPNKVQLGEHRVEMRLLGIPEAVRRTRLLGIVPGSTETRP